METLEVTIERLVFEGLGLGRLDFGERKGKVALVSGTAPQERVRARVLADHPGHLLAEVVEVIEASVDRVEAPCPHYGHCGGCHLMHIRPERALKLKAQAAVEAMARARGPGRPLPPPEVIASPLAWGYRHRLRLKGLPRPEGPPALGYYRRGTNEIVSISSCPVAHPLALDALEALREGFTRSRAAVTGLDIVVDGPGQIAVAMVHAPSSQRREIDRAVTLARQALPSLGGRNIIQYQVAGFTLSLQPDLFFQANLKANELLVGLVVPWALEGQESVLDLFCGVGNFTVPLASATSGPVKAMEIDRSSVHWARRNLATHGLTASVKAMDLSRPLRNMAESEVVILDPPRSGALCVARGLASQRPRRVIYVSCHPPTLGRDLAILEQGGFRVQRMALIDLFPATFHCEMVLLLEGP